MAEGSSRSWPGGGGSRLVLDDPDVVEVATEAAAGAGWGPSGCQKRNWKQVVPHDIIEFDANDDPDGVMTTVEKTSDHVNKQGFGFHKDWPTHAKSDVAMGDNFAGPSSIPVTNVDPWDGLEGFHLNVATPSASPTTHIYLWNGLGGFPQNAAGPSAIPAKHIYSWNGLGGFSQNATGSSAISATHIYPPQDAVDPSVIPTIHIYPWKGLGGFPHNAASTSAILATHIYPWNGLGGFPHNVASPSAIPATHIYPPRNAAGPTAIPVEDFCPWDSLGAYFGATVHPTLHVGQYSEATGVVDYAFNKGESNNYYNYNNSLMESGSNFNLDAMATSVGALLPLGNMISTEMSHQPSQTKIANNETDEKYNAFKQYDIVGDHSDHFYALPVPGNGKVQAVKKPSKNWVKRIQHEWKVLEKDLPDTIFVRVYEERMDLLRAVIVGPTCTPYHDGLFFFDIFFPSQYPSKPPLVSYRSGGLRLNPNLYNCGKVCLSLLNTWPGSGCEKWNPSNSTMLQVLVSIQALVLNSKPYFNEPGYAMQANTLYGENMSMAYNEEVFLLPAKQ